MKTQCFDLASNIFNKVRELEAKNDNSNALKYLDIIINNFPDFAASSYHYKGYIYFNKLNDYENALKSYSKSITINEKYHEAYISRAVLHRYDQNLDNALSDINSALSLHPNNKTALFNKAIILLSMGLYDEGWTLFENRLVLFPQLTPSYLRGARWDGRAIEDQTLLLHIEQGLGDTIQFLRYVPILQKFCKKIIIIVPDTLNSLLSYLTEITIINTFNETIQYDYYCSLLSLPFLLKNVINYIPDDIPYIKVESSFIEKWQHKVIANHKKRIGIAWCGSIKHWNDKNRSSTLEEMSPILNLNADIYVLINDITDEEAALLSKKNNVHNFSSCLKSLSDTGALISQMDYIITVDTSIAHLAGSLACNVFILLPFAADFRWQQHRSDSPWYPTAKLFRQNKRHDWHHPISEITQIIEQML